jgi:hypothetical protein
MEGFMKPLRTGLIFALALLLLSNCVTSPNMQRINVSSNVSSQILNLRNSGKGNTSTTIADRAMRNVFLNAGEEYGYYTLNMTSTFAKGDISFWGIFGSILGGIPFLFGIPIDYDDYNLTVKLDIINSNMNVIRSYSDSTTIRKYGGMYYGDATDKASAAFTRLVRNVQRSASADSTFINTELLAVGPIGRGQGGRAASVPSVPQTQTQQNDIVSALNKGAGVIMDSLKERKLTNLKIAIVNVSSTDREQAVFVAGEIEYLLVQNKFIIVDRSELDRIRKEQNFQLSGDVDDDQIVSIGRFAGANLVITGSITGSGNMRRLRLRALDTQSAELRGSASEPF